MAIVQSASGTFTGTSFTPTLGAASDSANCVVLIVAANTTVTTPTNWTLRTSQVNQMGHYLYDRQGVSLTSVSVSNSSGQGTWWIAEVAGGSYQTATSNNNTTGSGTYSTPSMTPTAGLRELIASIASLHASQVRTISGWSGSFAEIADVCYNGADFPMQGVAARDDVTTDGTTSYSTSATYSVTSTGRSALIGSYVTTTAAAAIPPILVMQPRR